MELVNITPYTFDIYRDTSTIWWWNIQERKKKEKTTEKKDTSKYDQQWVVIDLIEAIGYAIVFYLTQCLNINDKIWKYKWDIVYIYRENVIVQLVDRCSNLFSGE